MYSLIMWWKSRKNNAGTIRCYHNCNLDSLKKHDDTNVPEVIFRITKLLEKNLTVEGLYRKSGNKDQVLKLQNANPNKIKFDQIDVHDLASWLKTLLIDLDEPLLPKTMFEAFKLGASRQELEKSLAELNQVNRETLRHVMRHILKVIAEEETNKMSRENMCIVWAPVVYYPLVSQEDAEKCIAFFGALLDIHSEDLDKRSDANYESDGINSEIIEDEAVIGEENEPVGTEIYSNDTTPDTTPLSF